MKIFAKDKPVSLDSTAAKIDSNRYHKLAIQLKS